MGVVLKIWQLVLLSTIILKLDLQFKPKSSTWLTTSQWRQWPKCYLDFYAPLTSTWYHEKIEKHVYAEEKCLNLFSCCAECCTGLQSPSTLRETYNASIHVQGPIGQVGGLKKICFFFTTVHTDQMVNKIFRQGGCTSLTPPPLCTRMNASQQLAYSYQWKHNIKL